MVMIRLRRADAIESSTISYPFGSEDGDELMRELDQAITDTEETDAHDFVEVRSEVADRAYIRLNAYAHSQGDNKRWSRFKSAADRIYAALQEAGIR